MSETKNTVHASLAEALVAFQAEAPKFAKNKTAKVQTKTGGSYTYKYADLADILPVVGPLLAKHGLSWSSRPGRGDDGELVLRYRLLHTSGEADGDEMPLGVERNCRPQELGSAITYARRYAITAQLNLTTDEDDDGQAAMQASPSQQHGPYGAKSTWTTSPPASPPPPQGNVIDEASLAALRRAYKATGWTPAELQLNLTAAGVPDTSDLESAMAGLTELQAGELLRKMIAAHEASNPIPDPIAPEL